MTVLRTRSQQWAERAFDRVGRRKVDGDAASQAEKDYLSFAKKFPALAHTCGLAQAIAFALAKSHADLVEDLAAVLQGPDDGGAAAFAERTRTVPLHEYLLLSRQALAAAAWIKRYAECLLRDE